MHFELASMNISYKSKASTYYWDMNNIMSLQSVLGLSQALKPIKCCSYPEIWYALALDSFLQY